MASNDRYHVGDKFVIEIGHSYWSPTTGNKYFIKGFDTLMFDDKGLDRLERHEEPPKNVPHACEFCRYKSRDEYEMPCAVCDKNDIAPKDMFEAING